MPFLGIPGTWRNVLITLSGIFLILVSLGPTILKKLQAKPKPKKKNNPLSPPYIKGEIETLLPDQKEEMGGEVKQ